MFVKAADESYRHEFFADVYVPCEMQWQAV
jgi:hypothetical protein